MNQIRSLSDLSVAELRKVLHIKEQIAALDIELKAVLGAPSPAAPEAAPAVKPEKSVKGKRGGRRKLSPEARARIAAGQRARWAAARGGEVEVKAVAAAEKPAKRGRPVKLGKPVEEAKAVKGKRGGRRKLSPEARERIAAAQRARWAASRNGKATVVKPEAAAKPAGKRGGRRQLSPEARERIAAAQRARWAASRKAK